MLSYNKVKFNENEKLSNENDIISFHSELSSSSIIIPVIKSSSYYTNQFLQAMVKDKIAKIKKPNIDENLDRCSLSDMPPPPPIPYNTAARVLDEPPAYNLLSLSFEMGLSLAESVVCVQRSSKVESFDVEGLLRIATFVSSSDESFDLSILKEKIDIIFETIDKKGTTTLTETAEATIQISKEFATVLSYNSHPSFRPLLVQGRSKIEAKDGSAKVVIQIAFNQTLSSRIEKASIMASFVAFKDIIKTEIRPTGQYVETSKVVNWNIPLIDTKSNPIIQLEVLLEIKSLDKLPSSIPLIVKGFMQNSLMTEIDANIVSLTYGLNQENINFIQKTTKRTKFEYRLF